MRITPIAAGQADAALIQINQDGSEPFTLVVDGGDHDNDLKNHLPAMMTGDSTVELIVLSRPHLDHMGALDWLVRDSGFGIGRVWWKGETHTAGAFGEFETAIDNAGVVATRPHEAFYHFVGSPNFTLRVFNNGQEFPGTAGKDLNNDSLVFQIIYEPRNDVRVTAFFTGDIEEAQGAMPVSQFGDELKSDMVKVPHHGSDHLFDDFPAIVGADFAFVSSTGTHETFKHPRQAALELYDDEGEIHCTWNEALRPFHRAVTVDEDGAITVSPDQVPYLVWEKDLNDVLQKITITP